MYIVVSGYLSSYAIINNTINTTTVVVTVVESVNSHQLSLETVATERSLQLVKEATERETGDEKKTMREREKEMKEWNVK